MPRAKPFNELPVLLPLWRGGRRQGRRGLLSIGRASRLASSACRAAATLWSSPCCPQQLRQSYAQRGPAVVAASRHATHVSVTLFSLNPAKGASVRRRAAGRPARRKTTSPPPRGPGPPNRMERRQRRQRRAARPSRDPRPAPTRSWAGSRVAGTTWWSNSLSAA